MRVGRREERGDKWSAESGQEPVAWDDLSEPASKENFFYKKNFSPKNIFFFKEEPGRFIRTSSCSVETKLVQKRFSSSNKSRSGRRICHNLLQAKLFQQNLFKILFSKKRFFFKQDPVGREDLSEPPPASKQNFVFQKSVLQKTFFFFKQEPVAEKDLSEPPAASCKKTYIFFCFSQFSALNIR